MALKTFNVDAHAYKRYSSHCKKHGISMSRQVEKFIMAELTRIDNVHAPVAHMPALEPTSAKTAAHLKDTAHSMQKFC